MFVCLQEEMALCGGVHKVVSVSILEGKRVMVGLFKTFFAGNISP
jgi:hypothetical protein